MVSAVAVVRFTDVMAALVYLIESIPCLPFFSHFSIEMPNWPCNNSNSKCIIAAAVAADLKTIFHTDASSHCLYSFVQIIGRLFHDDA